MLGDDAMVLMVQGGEVWGAVALSWHRAARGLEVLLTVQGGSATVQ